MLSQPKLGLTLGGGGARGGAHVGVLRVLDEIGYRPDVVTGTSIGGVIAALVGAGWSVDEIERLAHDTPFDELLNIGRNGDGLLGNEALKEMLCGFFGDADLEDLPIRTGLVAADLVNNQPVLLERGPVVTAVLATTAVPGLFPAVRLEGRRFVDGGILSNVPTRAAYMLGAERLVAVDVGGHMDLGLALNDVGNFSRRLQRVLYWLLNLSKRQTAFDVFIQSTILSYNALVQYELAAYPPDVLIRPDIPNVGLMSMERLPETIEPGEAAAREAAPAIQQLVQNRWRRRRPMYDIPPLVTLNTHQPGERVD